MKTKLFLIFTLIMLVISIGMSGCKQADVLNNESQPTNSTTGQSVTITGDESQNSDMETGGFQTEDENNSKNSNAKEEGGSSTLDIELPEEETKPEGGDTPATEPQWQPGIW